MIRKVLFGAAILVIAFAAPAAAQYRPIVVGPDHVVVGGSVSVSGQGCAPNIPVTIYLIPGDTTVKPSDQGLATVPDNAIVVGTTTTDPSGNFSFTFKIPPGTRPGVYTVAATCGTLVRGDTITVDPTSTTAPPTGTGTTDLPTTGSNLNGVGLVGAGLLTAGGLVLLGTRKRRSTRVVAG